MVTAAAAAAKSLQSCLNLCDPIDVSPPGSPAPGVLQTRTLEWVAIYFSNVWKWKSERKLLSGIRLSDPMDCSLPGSSTHGIFQVRVLEWGAIAFSVARSLIIVFSHPGDWHVLEAVLWESTEWACKSFTFTENANLKLVSTA